MRELTYGEVAYRTFCGRTNTLLKEDSYDELDYEMVANWENTAAAVITEFRKRQLALGRRQTEDVTRSGEQANQIGTTTSLPGAGAPS